MTADQCARLTSCIPALQARARKKPTQNGYARAWVEIERMKQFLVLSEHAMTQLDQRTAEEWIAYVDNELKEESKC